jgi:hypothetical protein
MPYALPRGRDQQDAYNQQLQLAYASTRRVAAAPPDSGPAARDPLDDLARIGELHESGVLTDAEFAELKRRLLGTEDGST